MKTPNFDFMGKRFIAAITSAVALVVAVGALTVNGLNMGLDFTGGTLVELEFPQEIDPQEVRGFLDRTGYQNGTVQYFGSNRDILIRMPPQADIDQATLGDRIYKALGAEYSDVQLRQSNFVGPAVGEELTEDGGLALLTALIVVMLYILFRFTKQFSVGAVAALAHDVFIVLGFFALFQWTFDLTVLAALLAVIGYSLNDTIVVSDRIRENFRAVRRGATSDLIDTSLNQTLGRTLMTSTTTLLVLLALFFLGGELIRGFSLALTVGVVVGTYSSIYVASNMLVALQLSREDLLVPVKEGADQDVP